MNDNRLARIEAKIDKLHERIEDGAHKDRERITRLEERQNGFIKLMAVLGTSVASIAGYLFKKLFFV